MDSVFWEETRTNENVLQQQKEYNEWKLEKKIWSRI